MQSARRGAVNQRKEAIVRLGLIAPEFPPDVGGMAELGRGLASALAATDDVVVYTLPEHGVPDADFEQRPVLTGRLRRDLESLRAARVDAWIALNAGLAPIARRIGHPLFVIFNGNDFLDPWISYGDGWIAGFQRPYVAPLRKALRRAAIRRSADAMTGCFAVSLSTAALVTQHMGIAARSIEIHSPGVDDAFFQPRPPGPQAELRILTVTRLSRYTRRKNVDGVLRALPLVDPGISLRYTVVGDGDDRPRLESLASELGIEDRVCFRGGVDPQELLACYADADLFILASKASDLDVEGFGIVYLEASAAGVPVIASRAGGATDAVEEGRNGFLIPDSSPHSIARGIERFQADRQQYEPDQVRAFAERYRWPRVAAGIRRAVASRMQA